MTLGNHYMIIRTVRRFASLSCSECKRELVQDVIECVSCHARQPPPTHNLSYFSLLRPNHPPTLSVDQHLLKESYLRAMRRCHPDRARTACDKVSGEAWSAWINKAYRCLRDPFCRARHAYIVKCDPLVEDTEHDEQINGGMSTEELMEVLEKRETVEAATDTNTITVLAGENEARIATEWRVLEGALERGDCGTAKHVLNRLRYWQTLREACEERLAALKR